MNDQICETWVQQGLKDIEKDKSGRGTLPGGILPTGYRPNRGAGLPKGTDVGVQHT